MSGTGRRGADLARELHAVVAGDPDVTGYAGPVTLAGRVELLPFPREQAISITTDRYGNPCPALTDLPL
ncbi:MAG: hypothetical protein B7Y93_02245 [Micrococcales bacterium 32-70-13]|nr:MAG: hypothetical protein B7Y93_02245 [Micrococcales bacterium 32-70-13]